MHSLFTLLLPLFIAVSPAMAAEQKPIKVTASFSVLADIAQQVGGKRVQVTSIVPADGDAHSFEAKPSDIAKLKDTKVIVIQGVGFDDFVRKMAMSAKFGGPIVMASEGTKLLEAKEDDHDHGHDHHHDHGTHDPHTWHNPQNGIIAARNIAAVLTKLDPGGATTYAENLARFTDDVNKIDAEAKKTFAAMPAAQRKIITSHDAFGYLGDAYGITI
jgi:zinc/manganese transport system substrate-binding protein